MNAPQRDWSRLYSNGHIDVCAIICPALCILKSIPSFHCFCCPLFYISMDFPFNLGQHCEGRQYWFLPKGVYGNHVKLFSLRFRCRLWQHMEYILKLQWKPDPTPGWSQNYLMPPTLAQVGSCVHTSLG